VNDSGPIKLADIRKDYTLGALRKWDLADDPITQFETWFSDALAANVPEPSAMTLSTVDAGNQPSGRVVLLKDVDSRGFSFFTNYLSKKGQDLATNPRAALTFHWKELERQVCILGKVEKLSREESETYFNSRPFMSRCGAWVSQQSTVLPGRDVMEQKMKLLVAQYGKDEAVPTPPHWGGYRLKPDSIEFWQGQRSRLHDRLRYVYQSGQSWKVERLSP
jgi:pyridoxamine 5'-phosphate oxidase